MAQTDPSQEPREVEQRRVGRLRAAFQVLRGESLVPEQIRFEWLEYQQIFNDVLQRFSAQLARGAKAEKKRVAKLLEPGARYPFG